MNSSTPQRIATNTLLARTSANIELLGANVLLDTGGYSAIGFFARYEAGGTVTNWIATILRYDSRGSLLGAGNEFDGANPSTMTAGCVSWNCHGYNGQPIYQVSSGKQRFDNFAIPPAPKSKFLLGLTVDTTADIYFEVWGYT